MDARTFIYTPGAVVYNVFGQYHMNSPGVQSIDLIARDQSMYSMTSNPSYIYDPVLKYIVRTLALLMAEIFGSFSCMRPPGQNYDVVHRLTVGKRISGHERYCDKNEKDTNERRIELNMKGLHVQGCSEERMSGNCHHSDVGFWNTTANVCLWTCSLPPQEALTQNDSVCLSLPHRLKVVSFNWDLVIGRTPRPWFASTLKLE